MLSLLLINSHSEYSQTIEKKLKKEGYIVHAVSDAASAYIHLEKQYIDLILLDPNMPGEDGYTFCRSLRKSDGKTLVLMLSDHPSQLDKVMEQKTMTISYREQKWTPAPREFQLLYLLLSRPGIVFTRTQLIDELWGLDSESGPKTVNTHIARLRKILEYIPEISIVSIRGIGYKATWDDQNTEN